MCPACVAALSMIVAGVVSTGGVTVLAAKTLGKRKGGLGARVTECAALGPAGELCLQNGAGAHDGQAEATAARNEAENVKPEDLAEFVLMGA